MESALLAEAVDLCKMIVGEDQLFIRANKNILTVAAISDAGTTVICKMTADCNFSALSVDLAVFATFLKGNKEISLLAENQNLIISGKGLKGSVPFIDVDDFPKTPLLTDINCVKSSDIDWLTAIIPLVVVKALSKTGTFSANCRDKIWSIACSDSIHGAFVFNSGISKISFSLTPADALILNSIFKKFTKINLEVQENRLIIQTTNKRFSICLPLIEGKTQSKETVTKNTQVISKFNLLQFKEAVKIIAPIASSKNNSITKLILKEDFIIVSATSGSGSLSRRIAAKNKQNISLQVSFELLSDVVAQMSGSEALLLVFKEGKSITRLSFKASGVYYLMLTSE
jgi:hypothetical protein